MREWTRALPKNIREHLQAVRRDLRRGSPFVPGPMRTIIELVGRDQLPPGKRTFRQALVDLGAKFGLSQVELDRMQELLDEANAVLHEGKKHTRKVHEEMLALLEHFLQSVYLLPRKLAPTG